MYEILKRIQEINTEILERNPGGYDKIEFLQFNHHGQGSMIVRHEDQPNGVFHFVPGSEGVVGLPTDDGGYADLVGVKLV